MRKLYFRFDFKFKSDCESRSQETSKKPGKKILFDLNHA